MRSNTIISLLAATASLLLSGCTFLDEENFSNVTTDITYATIDSAEGAVEGLYSILANGNLYGGAMQQLTSYGTDEARCYFSSSDRLSNYFYYVSNFSHTASDSHLESAWTKLYAGIAMCNDLYENISELSTEDSKTKMELLGETLFMRAFFYFNLVQLWGEVRIIDEAPTIDNVVTTDIYRASIAEVYEFICSDMTRAVNYLPIAAARPGRVSRAAAYALQAKIYLTMASGKRYSVAGYDDLELSALQYYEISRDVAQTAIDNAAGLGIGLLDNYADVFSLDNKYNKEVLFEASCAVDGPSTSYPSLGGPTGAGDYAYAESGLSGRGYCRSSTYLATIVYDCRGTVFDTSSKVVDGITTLSYYDTRIRHNLINQKITSSYVMTNDLETDRDEWSVLPTVLNMMTYKFNLREHDMSGYTWTTTPMNLPILRYSELLLIYAEAAGMADLTDQSAYDAWNLVRARARADQVDGIPDDYLAAFNAGDFATQDDFMDEIMDERMRELCFEGHRRFDLCRTGRYLSAFAVMESRIKAFDAGMSGYTCEDIIADMYDADITAQMVDVNLDDRHKLFPIPQIEMNLISADNTNYQQNLGW